MSEIKKTIERYNWELDEYMIRAYEADDGKWVAYEDVADLITEVERLRADIENLCAENKRLRGEDKGQSADAKRPAYTPEQLVGALQDRIHPTSGRLIDAHPLVTSARKAQEDGR